MNWDAIGAIGEIVGAIAVVITLIYLAAQMRVNTAAVNRTATQNILQGRADLSFYIANDKEITALLWNGADDPDSLTSEEWQRFFFVVSGAVRTMELGFIDYEKGRMEEDEWLGQSNAILFWFPRPGFRKWVQEYGQTLTPGFRNYVEKIQMESEV